MAFKARRQPLNQRIVSQNCLPAANKTALPAGVRPSPLDGRLTTSTGTRSLDSLLAGHVGLALGNMLLIEETGTTDFGGYLLKYFTAEGVVQGHQVHVLGLNENWGNDLPGVTTETKSSEKLNEPVSIDRMKIAWRYERLGEFGAEASERSPDSRSTLSASIFCHDFDLSRRLSLSSYSNVKFIPTLKTEEYKALASPFTSFLSYLMSQLENSPPDTIHRVVIPSLLSPLFYPAQFCNPPRILQFLHSLRALLRKYRSQLTAIITLPLSLYHRTTGLTRWMELLSDGVFELAPFTSSDSATLNFGAKSVRDEAPQGIFKIHKVPIFHEKGGGSNVGKISDNLAFTMSRRKGLVIKPFSLPPIDGAIETNSAGFENGKSTEKDLQF